MDLSISFDTKFLYLFSRDSMVKYTSFLFGAKEDDFALKIFESFVAFSNGKDAKFLSLSIELLSL